MVDRFTIFDLFVLERWLESMQLRLTGADYESINEVRDELQRAVYELKCQRAQKAGE